MIARHWRGVAKADQADAYIHHLQTETFPSIRRLPGFVSASILRRTVPAGIEFLIVTHWASFDSIRAFAGGDIDVAVVAPAAEAMMVDYDRFVRHYEVVEGTP
ncbi:MAG TPA: antibiotic biosynthesis monooxygenase [Vicinamibacterales bacterium]